MVHPGSVCLQLPFAEHVPLNNAFLVLGLGCQVSGHELGSLGVSGVESLGGGLCVGPGGAFTS